MIRKLLKLTVFLLIANALYQVAPAWIHYYRFKDAVEELALFSKDAPDNLLVDRVMQLATEYRVPLSKEYVQVHRAPDRISIDAAYVEILKVLPGYSYPWEFDIGASAFHQTPVGVRR